jgi:NAD(P)-dependent dehydrogenase (short-subunit alcohol dehydrogenase family)
VEGGLIVSEAVTVVTGGASGLGKAIATAAHVRGDHVVVGDRDGGALSALVDELGKERLSTWQVDLTVPGEVAGWAADVVGQIGAPRNLVNNAGIGRWAGLEEQTDTDWTDVVEVNLNAAFFVTKYFGREMIHGGGGSIVATSSVGGLAPSAGSGAYSPTKAGISMLMRLAAVEWGKHGIRANSICPGFIRGGLAASFYDDPAVAEDRRSRVPLGRVGTPDEVVDVVMFLCSDAARYVSGQDIAIDGGWSQTVSSSAPRFRAEIARATATSQLEEP